MKKTYNFATASLSLAETQQSKPIPHPRSLQYRRSSLDELKALLGSPILDEYPSEEAIVMSTVTLKALELLFQL